MPERHGRCDRDLIFDVGMNDGSDTAYYLHCGYRVLSVEANPALTEAAEQRFRCEIVDGRLTVLNIGIAQNEGECDFWISEANHQWSSFLKPVAARRGTTTLAQPIRVRCLPLSAVLENYGVPYYLKMDIEGYDLIGLESMSKKQVPQYISVEFAHGLEMKLLDRLRSLGYTRFKLLNQSTFTGKMPIFEHEIGLRSLRKLYRKMPLLQPLIRGLVRRSDFDTLSGVENWKFPEGSSGPFGEQTRAPWMTAQEIMKKYTTIRRAYRKAEMVFWWDLHATA